LVDITSDTAIQALTWMQKMVKEGLMPPVHKESFGNWLKGGTAMILSYDVAGTIYQQTFGKDSAMTGTTIFKTKGQPKAGVPFWMNALVVLDKAKNAQGMTDFYLWWFGPNNKANGKQMTEVAAKPCYQYTYDEFVKNNPAQAWQMQGIELVRNSKPFNVNIPNTTEQTITTPYVEKVLDLSQNTDPKQAMESALADIKAELAKQK
jgi:ABC-type glycerol-3-phosphate transport system substrate-binding protein